MKAVLFGGRDAAKKAAADAAGTWESLDGRLTKFETFVRSPEYLRARYRQKLKHRFSETDRGLAKTRDGCVPALKALPASLKGLPQRAQEGGKALAEKARACPAPAWKAADDIKALARGVPPAAKEAADVTVTVAKAAVDELAGAAKQGVAEAKGLLQRTKKQE